VYDMYETQAPKDDVCVTCMTHKYRTTGDGSAVVLRCSLMSTLAPVACVCGVCVCVCVCERERERERERESVYTQRQTHTDTHTQEYCLYMQQGQQRPSSGA